MKRLILLSMVILLGNSCFALDIVYPKTEKTVINADSTFFIGNTNSASWLRVNGNNVKLSKSGAFAYVVNLKEGTNTFVIESGAERKTYIINKKYTKQVGACLILLLILIALLLIIRAIMMPKNNVTNRELKSDFIIEVI